MLFLSGSQLRAHKSSPKLISLKFTLFVSIKLDNNKGYRGILKEVRLQVKSLNLGKANVTTASIGSSSQGRLHTTKYILKRTSP